MMVMFVMVTGTVKRIHLSVSIVLSAFLFEVVGYVLVNSAINVALCALFKVADMILGFCAVETVHLLRFVHL